MRVCVASECVCVDSGCLELVMADLNFMTFKI